MKPWDDELDHFYYAGDQLRQHIWERAQVCFQREKAEKDALTSVAAYEKRRSTVRRRFIEALGGLPTEKTPLNVQERGIITRPGYRIKKLIFESLPSFHVTANLYVPDGITKPRPAVLFVCGHTDIAKAGVRYQSQCQALARAGFVVLAIDPLGQGERLTYWNPATQRPDIPPCTAEHSYTAFKCSLTGYNLARYFIWDEIRAVDLLVSRPEVDAERIGVTGQSGGGTQTHFITMVDDRIAAAAPCCYTNERQAYFNTGKYHDGEQNWHGTVQYGINFDDTLGAIAPKPVQICAVASDYFPVDGALQTFTRLQQIYGLYGAAANVRMVVDSGNHMLTPVHIRENVNFFRRHLMGEDFNLGPALAISAGPLESPYPANIAPLPKTLPTDTEPPETLNCTQSGQVIEEFGDLTRTADQLNLAAWQQWKASAPPRSAASVQAALSRHIRDGRGRSPIWARSTNRGGGGNEAFWQHIYFFSEPGIAIGCIEARAPGVGENAPLTVVVADEGSTELMAAKQQFESMLAEHGRLSLVDPRGLGSVAQHTICPKRDANNYGGTEHSLNFRAIQLCDSLWAMRSFDIDRALEYAHRLAPIVNGYSKGRIGLCLLAAAALRGEPMRLELIDCPSSWEYFVKERLCTPPYSYEVFGILRDLDVPDMESLVHAAGGTVTRC